TRRACSAAASRSSRGRSATCATWSRESAAAKQRPTNGAPHSRPHAPREEGFPHAEREAYYPSSRAPLALANDFPVAFSLGCPGSALARGDVGPPRLQQLGDQPRPTGLVHGPDAAAGVAVEVLVERDVIAEVWVGLQLGVVAVHCPPA